MSIIGSVLNGVQTPLSVGNTALRHALDINIAAVSGPFVGTAGDRYNARTQYRTSYDAKQRYGAGLGVVAGTALPALGVAAWAKPGVLVSQGFRAWKNAAFAVPEFASGGWRVGAAGVGVGVAAGATYVGVKKAREIIADDGHYGIVGSTAGIVGGYAAGHIAGRALMPVASKVSMAAAMKLANSPGMNGMGKWALGMGILLPTVLTPLAGAALATAGGIYGYKGGKAVDAGPGNIGKPAPDAAPVATEFPGTIRDFSRGFVNHFNEAGPTSQGISFGNHWGMRQAYETNYSKSERAGAMSGDLVAATILGGGALAAGSRLVRGGPAGQAGSIAERFLLGHYVEKAAVQLAGRPGAQTSAFASPQLAAKLADPAAKLSGIEKVLGKATPANLVGAAAVGVLGGIAAKNTYDWVGGWGKGSSGEKSMLQGAAGVAGMGALGVGMYALGARSGFAASAGAARPMLNMVTVAVLLSALSAARMPVQQFIYDGEASHNIHGKDVTPGARYGAMAAGAAVLGASALSVAKVFTPSMGGKGTLIRAGATLMGAAAGGMAGHWYSSTLPDAGKVAYGAAAGAGALGLATAGLTFRNPGVAARSLKAATMGGLMGGMASAVLAKDTRPAVLPEVGSPAGG